MSDIRKKSEQQKIQDALSAMPSEAGNSQELDKQFQMVLEMICAASMDAVVIIDGTCTFRIEFASLLISKRLKRLYSILPQYMLNKFLVFSTYIVRGTIKTANDEFLHMFLYDRWEVIGTNIKIMM